MSKTVTVDELARNLPGYISEVVDRGEHVFLKRGTQVVAELRPVSRPRKMEELPAILASLPHLTPKEAEEFEKDIEQVRERLNQQKARDPWAT
jgi:antitoxin (DNA-binding transcriptional repressor) of toxin-antitoxin stability system